MSLMFAPQDPRMHGPCRQRDRVKLFQIQNLKNFLNASKDYAGQCFTLLDEVETLRLPHTLHADLY